MRGADSAAFILVMFPLLGTPAMSNMPPNPERPMNATTCEEALARLREVEQGSPLVSRRRNRELVAEARAMVERLCGGEKPKDNHGD